MLNDGNNTIWNEFYSRLSDLFYICNGKRVAIWGYGKSGWVLEHLFRRYHKNIEYIIDDGGSIHPKVRINRSIILEETDYKTTVVLLTFAEDEKVNAYLKKLGYVENENYIYIRKWFYHLDLSCTQRPFSYQDWLEYNYKLDILKFVEMNEIEKPSEDGQYYSAGLDYALVDVLDNFEFKSEDGIFDFGCGKGGALILFNMNGVNKIGGVEYDKMIFDIACKNFNKLELDNKNLINDDAGNINEQLDNFNYFFMYNPFSGGTFCRVIQNIERSYQRRKRKITIIYSGPYCSKIILENKLFVLSKNIYTDYSVRDVNIYITKE